MKQNLMKVCAYGSIIVLLFILWPILWINWNAIMEIMNQTFVTTRFIDMKPINELQTNLSATKSTHSTVNETQYNEFVENNLIFNLPNELTHKTIQCNVTNITYIKLLLQDIKHSIMQKEPIFQAKWTTKKITKQIQQMENNSSEYLSLSNNNLEYLHSLYNNPEYPSVKTFFDGPFNVMLSRYLRIKLLPNGNLYYNNKYRNAYSLNYRWYFGLLHNKYKTYFSDNKIYFDLLMSAADAKRDKWDWTKHLPIFSSDARFYKNQKHMFLHFITRDFLRSICGRGEKSFFQNLKYDKDFDKKFNKMYFIGSRNYAQNIRDEYVFLANYGNFSQYISDINDSSQYFDVHFTFSENWKMSDLYFCDKKHPKCMAQYHDMLNELDYKYHLVLEGWGSRDALFRQMHENAIIIKPNNTVSQWYYYDLKHHYNSFIFNDKEEFYSIFNYLFNNVTMEKQNILRNIAKNGKEFAYKHLSEANMDCFAVFMLKLYTVFFYDTDSIYMENNDVEFSDQGSACDINMVP